MDTKLDTPESLNDGTEVQDSNPEEVVDNTAELAKAKEVAENQRIRAEKAEAKIKALKLEKSTPKNETQKENYSLQDIRALQDVHDEDVDEITEYAKFKGITIAEAKKNPIIQNTLRTRAEERATAAAANVGTSKRGASSGVDVIEQAKRGEEVDMNALAEARIAKKKAERGLK